GKADRDEDVVRLERGRKEALEELARGDCAAAALSGDRELGIACNAYGRQLGGGVGVRQAAANRAAVADLRVRDVGHRRMQQRIGAAYDIVFLDGAVARHGSDDE